MKVRCIDNLKGSLGLTVGEIYNVLGENTYLGEESYLIKNDYNLLQPYLKQRFEIVKENNDMKELTLQEVLNCSDGTKFKMQLNHDGKADMSIEVELNQGDLMLVDDVYSNASVSEIFTLKMILKSKYYLTNQWQEIDYYTAYTTTNSNIKFIAEDEEIIGTHYYILSKLNSDCNKNGKNINEVLSNGKWFIKEQ